MNKQSVIVGIVIVIAVIAVGSVFSTKTNLLHMIDQTNQSNGKTQTAGQQTMNIKIPLLTDSQNAEYSGKISGCDKVVMSDRTIAATTTPLTAAYQTLFADTTAWPPISAPGNFIQTRTQLHFDHVAIQNGVASVYLTGQVGPLGGVCDDPRLKTQLTETALQFPTVQSVQMYLNGAKTDFTFSEK
jgi:hypothetical protein